MLTCSLDNDILGQHPGIYQLHPGTLDQPMSFWTPGVGPLWCKCIPRDPQFMTVVVYYTMNVTIGLYSNIMNNDNSFLFCSWYYMCVDVWHMNISYWSPIIL